MKMCVSDHSGFPPWTINWARARADMVRLVRRLLNLFRRNVMEAGGGVIRAELERRAQIPDLFWGQS